MEAASQIMEEKITLTGKTLVENNLMVEVARTDMVLKITEIMETLVMEEILKILMDRREGKTRGEINLKEVAIIRKVEILVEILKA